MASAHCLLYVDWVRLITLALLSDGGTVVCTGPGGTVARSIKSQAFEVPHFKLELLCTRKASPQGITFWYGKLFRCERL